MRQLLKLSGSARIISSIHYQYYFEIKFAYLFKLYGVFGHWDIHLVNGKTFFCSLNSTNFTSTTEQLIRHFTSLIKPEVLSVSVFETGKLLLCGSGMF